MKKTRKARFDAFKLAASVLALSAGAGLGASASAQTIDTNLQPYLDIVTNHEVPPGPGGNPAFGSDFASSPFVLDPAGVNGVGQQIAFIQTGPLSAGLSLCSGTLINPRTVITAAHCVYNNPAHMYGSDTGTGGGVNGPFGTGGATLTSQGIPYSFGFSSTNRCIAPSAIYPTGNGCAVGTGPYEQWRDSNFSTNVALAIYNANQVWYNRNSQPVALGGGGEFANGDIALVTLDTHVEDIPTWTLLFSQLDGPTHSTITGYGAAGVGTPGIGNFAGIDYRRRSAENMIDALFNQRDWGETPQIGFPPGGLEGDDHAIYWNDFDDPDFNNVFNPATWCINTSPVRNNAYCDQNGLGGVTLPLEGSTAGGDSGGPLIVDERFDRPVVAGVLTGTWSATGIVSYGQWNVYPPLFLFWEEIVTNNPYVYAGNVAGNRDWTNPAHWVQLMDPNYGVVGPDGNLVNSLPSTPQGGSDGDVDKFGAVCFFGDCTDYTETYTPEPGGPYLVIPGGPGSTNFVPNNIEPINSADPNQHVRATYYDVTLSAAGETRVTTPITIDRLAMTNGYTTLDVRNNGNLSVWSDVTIDAGWLNVDGRLNSGEMLVVQGIITGEGTINPTYMTSVMGAIAPNGSDIGTLTIEGDVVLASGSNVFMEMNRNGADLLRILEDASDGTDGDIMLGGALRLSKASGPAPRHGQEFTIITADGSVIDTFDQVYGQMGVINPEVIYLSDSVRVRLRAGNFSDVILGGPPVVSFAHALDDLREGSYNLLYDLYGELDVMDFANLNRAFSALVPTALFDANDLLSMQDSNFNTTLQNRMALLSRSDPGALGLSVMGTPASIFAFGGDDGMAAASQLAFASSIADSHQVMQMPNGLSAFFSGGYDDSRAAATSGQRSDTDSMRTWHFVGGIEQTMGDFTVGFAGGYSRGEAAQSAFGAMAENDVAQSAIYGVYRFDGGAYVSGLVGAGASRASLERRFATGALDYHLQGQMEGDLFLGAIEAGYNFNVGDFTLTPNVSLRHYALQTAGLDETGGEAALSIEGQEFERDEARLGLRFAGETVLNSGWRITPTLDASLVANLGGDDAGVWTRFVDAPDVPFYLAGAERDTYWGELMGGLRLVRGDTSFALSVETSVGREEAYEDRYMARYARRF